jgi:hypothetical protein
MKNTDVTNNKFLVTHSITDQRCLALAIASLIPHHTTLSRRNMISFSIHSSSTNSLLLFSCHYSHSPSSFLKFTTSRMQIYILFLHFIATSTVFLIAKSYFSYPYPNKWGRFNVFLSCCDKDSAIIFTTGRLAPAWLQPSLKLEWVLTTANAAGTNGDGLTCLPKHWRARDSKFWSPILCPTIETVA